jgi:hypothetical protein
MLERRPMQCLPVPVEDVRRDELDAGRRPNDARGSSLLDQLPVLLVEREQRPWP